MHQPSETIAHPVRLFDLARQRMRAMRYSKRTEQAYLGWIDRFLRFVRQRDRRWRPPAELGVADVNEFLVLLAVERNVAPRTQNQALAALAFWFKSVLHRELPAERIVRAKEPRRLLIPGAKS